MDGHTYSDALFSAISEEVESVFICVLIPSIC